MKMKMLGIVAVLCLCLLPSVAVADEDDVIVNEIDWVAYLDPDSMKVFWNVTIRTKNILVFSIEGNITEKDVEIGKVKLWVFSVYYAERNKGYSWARFRVDLYVDRSYRGMMVARFWYVDEYEELEGRFFGWGEDAFIRGTIEDVGPFAFAVKGKEYIRVD